MNIMLAGMFGGWEIVLILAVVLILFGAKKLPELAKGLGQGIKEFKKATREVSDEIQSAMDDNPSPYNAPSTKRKGADSKQLAEGGNADKVSTPVSHPSEHMS